jgi:UDP-glucose 4-epimerase
VSGVDFPVRVSHRRPGDPAAIVARADRIREALDWHPQYDDLATIVRHALAWERKISAKPSAAA